MALRVVGPVGGGGGLVKAAVPLPVLCVHVRRETIPPTQLGVAWAFLKAEIKKLVRVAFMRLGNENATKAAYIKDDLTGKKKGNKNKCFSSFKAFLRAAWSISLLSCT